MLFYFCRTFIKRLRIYFNDITCTLADKRLTWVTSVDLSVLAWHCARISGIFGTVLHLQQRQCKIGQHNSISILWTMKPIDSSPLAFISLPHLIIQGLIEWCITDVILWLQRLISMVILSLMTLYGCWCHVAVSQWCGFSGSSRSSSSSRTGRWCSVDLMWCNISNARLRRQITVFVNTSCTCIRRTATYPARINQ